MTDTETQMGARCGALAPDFMLRDVARAADAAPVRLRALRQRRPAVVALLPGAEAGQAEQHERWLRALAERHEDLEYYGAAIFAVALESEARRLLGAVDVPFPILVDVDGATLTAYLGSGVTLPALAVVDRYSQLTALLRAAGPNDAPDLDAAVRELGYADQQDCACTVPAW